MNRPSPPTHEDQLAKNAAVNLLDCLDRSLGLPEYLQTIAAATGLEGARLAYTSHCQDVKNSKLSYQSAILRLGEDEFRESDRFMRETMSEIERGTEEGERWLKTKEKSLGTG